jgi:hypothetical protein
MPTLGAQQYHVVGSILTSRPNNRLPSNSYDAIVWATTRRDSPKSTARFPSYVAFRILTLSDYMKCPRRSVI